MFTSLSFLLAGRSQDDVPLYLHPYLPPSLTSVVMWPSASLYQSPVCNTEADLEPGVFCTSWGLMNSAALRLLCSILLLKPFSDAVKQQVRSDLSAVNGPVMMSHWRFFSSFIRLPVCSKSRSKVSSCLCWGLLIFLCRRSNNIMHHSLPGAVSDSVQCKECSAPVDTAVMRCQVSAAISPSTSLQHELIDGLFLKA